MIPEQYLGQIVEFCHNHYIVDGMVEQDGDMHVILEDSDGGIIVHPWSTFQSHARILEAR